MVIEAILLLSTPVLMIILLILILTISSTDSSNQKARAKHQFKSMTTDIKHLKANVSGN